VEKLAGDLRKEFPNTAGFSASNLWFMRQFYLEYRDHTNLLQLAREIPWFSNVTIFSKVKDTTARKYYLKATAEMGWSRNVLLNQIKANAYERHLLQHKQHNFERALPMHLAEQADKSMKDVYMLDFLGITKPVLERELEQRMVAAIKDVLLELGYGFSFLGNQYRIKAGNNEYFIDLLFYHRRLKCLVAIELKAGKFQPEYAGKMNFYLNLLDDNVREKDENPSIGIILCADRDHLEVEYALRGIQKPMGVAEYRLTNKLPKALAGKLPDAEKLRREIMRELEGKKG
jgi:predicted nuclease of restriction endonuclease-like (RecB) superfamily